MTGGWGRHTRPQGDTNVWPSLEQLEPCLACGPRGGLPYLTSPRHFSRRLGNCLGSGETRKRPAGAMYAVCSMYVAVAKSNCTIPRFWVEEPGISSSKPSALYKSNAVKVSSSANVLMVAYGQRSNTGGRTECWVTGNHTNWWRSSSFLVHELAGVNAVGAPSNQTKDENA